MIAYKKIGAVAIGILLSNSCTAKKTGSVTASTEASGANSSSSFECTADTGRQNGQVLPTEGKIVLKYSVDGERAKLSDVIGFISTNYDFNIESNGSDKTISNYTGVFKGDFENKVNYKPTTYKEHYKFDHFNAVVTSNWDGGVMKGYLVLNKNHTKAKIDAHYVFQAGDHIGGTIDLTCKKIDQ